MVGDKPSLKMPQCKCHGTCATRLWEVSNHEEGTRAKEGQDDTSEQRKSQQMLTVISTWESGDPGRCRRDCSHLDLSPSKICYVHEHTI